MIGQFCLDTHLPERGNLYTHCAPYKLEGIQECLFSILFSIILILMEISKYELSTIFTIYGIYQYIFSLDIFISFSEASVLITWVFYTLSGHHSESKVFSTHLDVTVQTVAVKAVTPGGDH